MDFLLRRTIRATELPVTLAQAKNQVGLPVSVTEYDDHLQMLIGAATDQFERMTRLALLPQTWVYERQQPCKAIELPRSPLLSITTVESKENLEDSFVAVDSADYTLESDRSPARLTWADSMPKYIRVTYQAGYANPNAIPSETKLTILQIVTHYFENRGDTHADFPVALKGLIESQSAGTFAGYWHES